MHIIVEPSDAIETWTGEGKLRLRYEDISQDGQLKVSAMMHAMTSAFWGDVALRMGFSGRDDGMVAILTRMQTDGGDGPIGLHQLVHVDARVQLGRVDDALGAVDKIVVAVWLDLIGVIGRVWGHAGARAGERVRVGRVFCEHVLTRPFAPAGERKVTSFEPMPVASYPWQPSSALLQLPPTAVAIDDVSVDPTPIVFGHDHSDSNRHTNSLVYPRLFLDGALRRLVALGAPPDLIARRQCCAFRKPTFAGQALRLSTRAYRMDEGHGALLSLHDVDDSSPARAHATGQVFFESSAD